MRGQTLVLLASIAFASTAWAVEPPTCSDGSTGVEVVSPDPVSAGVPDVAGATIELGGPDGIAAVCNPESPHVSATPTVHVITEDPIVDTVLGIAEPIIEQVLGLLPPVPPLPP
ncbi:MAG: hypothetical protein LC624_00440 [Halobacteriales archaeon]|nr:hypothetical protein [Halobacteriales archaeon]